MEALFSPSWYRIASIRPRLRSHVEIYRHFYRGELWYVLQDRATGRSYRFTPPAYDVIGLMDGELTVHELWDEASRRFGDDAPTQGEVVRLLGQLHSAGALVSDVPPDTGELLRRGKASRQARWKQNFRSPLAIRVPLFDPERFLTRTAWVGRCLFSWPAAILWTLVVGAAVCVASVRWPEISRDVADRVLSAQGLVSLWVVYPFVKAFHELGHGYAVKRWGGEVHDMGILFLVLMPVPYVDASGASAFPEARRRALVGAAGILAELFVAALALFYWALAEPGVLRALAYNAFFLASVSTVLFNGNPLLRYDGYYVLSDLAAIPNLAERSTRYVAYLVQRYLLGAKDAERPYVAPREVPWLSCYAVVSFLYRAFVYTAIVLFLAGKFFYAGVILALWAVASVGVWPLARRVHFLLTSPILHGKRWRASAAGAAVAALAAWLLFGLPIPWSTRAEGVLWLPEQAIVRAGADGFVQELLAWPDERVVPGQPLIECEDPLLEANLTVLEAQVRELEARRAAAFVDDRVQVSILDEELEARRGEVARARERKQTLLIRSPCGGRLVLAQAEDLPGRFVRRGVLLGYVIGETVPIVRVVVSQEDVDLVRGQTRSVRVRPVEDIDRVVVGVLKREVPGGAEELPHRVLGSLGGGAIPVDPGDAKGTRSLEKLFQFEVELEEPLGPVFVGSRVFVRFDHGAQPLAERVYRRLRQTFLRLFNV